MTSSHQKGGRFYSTMEMNFMLNILNTIHTLILVDQDHNWVL